MKWTYQSQFKMFEASLKLIIAHFGDVNEGDWKQNRKFKKTKFHETYFLGVISWDNNFEIDLVDSVIILWNHQQPSEVNNDDLEFPIGHSQNYGK